MKSDIGEITSLNLDGHMVLLIPRNIQLEPAPFFMCDTIIMPREMDIESKLILKNCLSSDGNWIEY